MKPWEEAGISRATWYRRRQKADQQASPKSLLIVAYLELQEENDRLKTEGVAKDVLIAKQALEIDRLNGELLELRQKLVGVKWP